MSDFNAVPTPACNRLREQLADSDSTRALTLASNLFELADALLEVPQLRRLFADQGTSRTTKQRVFNDGAGTRFDEGTKSVVNVLLLSQFRDTRQLISEIEALGTEALISAAKIKKVDGLVELQLFQLEAGLRYNPEAVKQLSDSSSPTQVRRRLVESLISSHTNPITVEFARRATSNLSRSRFLKNVHRYASAFAASRQLTVAKVTSPVAMNALQIERLERILSRRIGRKVEAFVIVEPGVISGLEVEGRVLDDTIRTKLYQAERLLRDGISEG
jgi:F-type H+-transporting ATPase subunit delta